MQEWVRVISRTSSALDVVLNHPDQLDVNIFKKMAADDYCLKSMLHDPKRALIRYSTQDLVTLSDFLDQVSFENEDGYLFLKNLFECAIAVNRNKPVLFDPSFVFVSGYGDAFFFLVVPLRLEEWMFQKVQIQEWVQYLRDHFKTTTDYEIPGFLVRFLQAKEFSLPNLVLGLDQLKRTFHPKRSIFFWNHKKEIFRLKEPVRNLYDSSVLWQDEPLSSQDQTQLIGHTIDQGACLESLLDNQRFELRFETTLIGRSIASDIRLPDDSISLKHAEILCENDRYYIKDLKSKNGTYLNDKKVIRKMRLKDQMVISFGSCSFRFHQEDAGS